MLMLTRYRVPLFIVLLGLVVLALMIKFKPTTKAVVRTEHAPLVETLLLTAKSGPLLLRGNGIVTPKTQTTLASQIAGKIVSVAPQFVNGGFFNKHDVLLSLDQRNFIAK